MLFMHDSTVLPQRFIKNYRKKCFWVHLILFWHFLIYMRKRYFESLLQFMDIGLHTTCCSEWVYMLFSVIVCFVTVNILCQLYNYTFSWPIQNLFQLTEEYSALNMRGLTAGLTPRWHTCHHCGCLNYAKYPLHLGGVRQWLQEDLPNSCIPW